MDVLNPETSRLVNPLQPRNISLIYLTLDVSKPEASRLVNPLQPLNIELMPVTLDVSKLERSKLVNPLQFSNMPFISVTLEVSSSLKFSIAVSFLNPELYLESANIEFESGLARIFPAPLPAMMISVPVL